MKKIAVLAAVVPLAAAGTALASHEAPSIKLESAHASGHTIVVRVEVEHWKMLPARVGKKPNAATGGHWHIFVDGKYNNYSANPTTGRSLKVASGTHTVQVELANNDHSELSPPVKSRVMRVRIG